VEEVTYEDGEIPMTSISNEENGSNQTYNGYKNKSNYSSSSNGNGYVKKPFKPTEPSIKVIYTDGGSRALNLTSGKHLVGAWSFYDETSNEIRGKAEDNATNNQMELMAVLSALEYLNELGVAKDQWVTIKLDSDYVRYGILFWIKKWIANGWRRQNKDGQLEEVKNRDLWEKIHDLSTARKVYWEHVPAHSGFEGNEKVDTKCGQLIQEFIDNAELMNDVVK